MANPGCTWSSLISPYRPQDLSLIPVTTLQEVMDIITLGLKLRATHETRMNQVIVSRPRLREALALPAWHTPFASQHESRTLTRAERKRRPPSVSASYTLVTAPSFDQNCSRR